MLLWVIKKVNNNTYIGNGEFSDSYHVASGEPNFYQACYKDAPSNVDTDSVIIDDEDLAQLIYGCFDDDDVLRTDLVKDVKTIMLLLVTQTKTMM